MDHKSPVGSEIPTKIWIRVPDTFGEHHPHHVTMYSFGPNLG